MLEKTEWAIKNGQSRETGNIGHTRHRTRTNKNTTQYVLDPTERKETQIMQTQTIGDKEEPNIVASLILNANIYN
jgi:hypothetical protein